MENTDPTNESVAPQVKSDLDINSVIANAPETKQRVQGEDVIDMIRVPTGGPPNW